jgi:hypothetical protein
MVGKQKRDIINPGFVLHAPMQGRALGRPRKNIIRSMAEGRVYLGQGNGTVRDVEVQDILQELVKM